ncbi:MAG: dockerin type I domain-containing protein [Planctomycetota bacterium]
MARTATFIKYLFLGFVILTGGIASTANAANWIVPGPGIGTFSTIQEAIDDPSVNDMDFITLRGNLITPNIYSGAGFYNVDFKGKDVTVRAGDASGNAFPFPQTGLGTVIIDCCDLGRAFIFQSGETGPFAGLKGLIIRNGYAEDLNWPQDPSVDASGYGGAIYCKGSSPLIYYCEIYNCISDAGGGAIFCDENSDARISFCDIGLSYSSYNYAGLGFYKYIDVNDVNDVNALDVNDLHQLGGGIYCRNSSPTIDNCYILWNTAAGSGGGIACENSNALIWFCLVYENDAFVNDDRIDQHGGGIYLKDCKGPGPQIRNCITSSNTTRWSGGGIAVMDSNALIDLCDIYDNHCWASAGGIYSDGNPHSDPNIDPNKPNCIIQNCNIVFNWGYWSGGVSSNYGSFADIDNCTIAGNIASWSWLVGGLETYSGGANVTNTNIWGNTGVQQASATVGFPPSALSMEFSSLELDRFVVNPDINVTYSNIQIIDNDGFYDPTAVWSGEGNINKDPMFVNPIFRPYDFHLQNTSPSVNAGNPFAEYSLEPAPNGGRINIGAYGGTEEASGSDILRPVPADADADLMVNMVDFAILGDNWGLEGENIKNKKADFDNNGIVDGRDLSILQKFWLWLQ